MTEITVYTYAVPIIIALILGEAIYSNIKGLNFYKVNDTLGSYGLLAGNVVVSLLTKGSFLLFNIYLYQFRLFTINDLMHVFFVVVLTFAAIDFIYYWFHRCSHRIKFLWAMHMNHHSSEEMNFVVSLRQAWFAPFAKVIFFIPLIKVKIIHPVFVYELCSLPGSKETKSPFLKIVPSESINSPSII